MENWAQPEPAIHAGNEVAGAGRERHGRQRAGIEVSVRCAEQLRRLPRCAVWIGDWYPNRVPALVRQLLRSKAHVIRLRILIELDGLDFVSALPRGLGHAMHAIHDGAARGQDYRER